MFVGSEKGRFDAGNKETDSSEADTRTMEILNVRITYTLQANNSVYF